MNISRALKTIGLTVIIIVVSSAYVRAFSIPFPSMSPTFLIGDVIFSNHAAYDLRLPYMDAVIIKTGEPQNGDVIIYFDIPKNVIATKRIIAIPGDRVRMENNMLFINGTEVTQHPIPQTLFDEVPPEHGLGQLVVTEKLGRSEYVITYTPNKSPVHSFQEVTAPEGKYFILGDHRDNSADSRYIGFISREQIKGRVIKGARTPNSYAKL
ncbi:signal peptidase I [Arsukibacterium sp.]|uniref:signal peptidase I n=1 Tax=Arsukibacterium sp. TaxID=1977258 RepID=UPI002FDB8A0A